MIMSGPDRRTQVFPALLFSGVAGKLSYAPIYSGTEGCQPVCGRDPSLSRRGSGPVVAIRILTSDARFSIFRHTFPSALSARGFTLGFEYVIDHFLSPMQRPRRYISRTTRRGCISCCVSDPLFLFPSPAETLLVVVEDRNGRLFRRFLLRWRVAAAHVADEIPPG